MNIVFDIGNTLIKVGFFDGDSFVKKEIYPVKSIKLNKIINPADKVLISASGNINNLKIKESGASVHFLTPESNFPIEIDYKTPQTLGHDRIAGAVGARFLCSDKNILIIDAGTAITFDFLNENIFLGGNISPGLSLRYKSLHISTSRLPLGKVPNEQTLTGKTSAEAVNNGVFNGLVYEITGVINSFMQQHKDLKIFITGGDANYFVNKIKNPIFAEPNLVLIGLNQILKYN